MNVDPLYSTNNVKFEIIKHAERFDAARSREVKIKLSGIELGL